MPSYQIELKDTSGRAYFRSDANCANDAEAVSLTRKLLRRPGSAEVWQGPRLVERIIEQPPPLKIVRP